MKATIVLLCIFTISIQSIFANEQNTHKLMFKNIVDIGFEVQITAFSCDSSFVIPYQRIRNSDTVFEFPSNYYCFIYSILNVNRSAQITSAIYCNSSELKIFFNYPKDVNNLIKSFSRIEFQGDINETNFGLLVNQLMVTAMSREYIDSVYFGQGFRKFNNKNPENLLALWFEYNLLGLNDSIRKDKVKRLILECKGYGSVLFPSDKKKSKIKFQTAEMKYDTFLNYLSNNVKPGKGVSEPKFDSDTCYLIFWASWCGPCIQQIKAMAPEEFSHPNTYFISIDSEVSNGISRAEKLGIQKRLFFMPPEILEILGYKTIPLHLVLIKNERKVIEE